MSREQELYEARERLARTDKYLAKLYRWNANIGHKIARVQRERIKLVQAIQSLEVREGVRDGHEPRRKAASRDDGARVAWSGRGTGGEALPAPNADN